MVAITHNCYKKLFINMGILSSNGVRHPRIDVVRK